MGFGFKVFVISRDEISGHLSQKDFQRFTLGDAPALKAFAGRMIDLAVAYYDTENRRPSRVIRVDGMRFKVNSRGAMDRAHREEALRIAASKLDSAFGRPRIRSNGSVVNAAGLFYDRMERARHDVPISPRLRAAILDDLRRRRRS